MLFTAGLSVIFFLLVVRDFEQQKTRTSTDAVIVGENALRRMSGELHDAKRFVAAYEALRRYVIRKYSLPTQVEKSIYTTTEANIEKSESITTAPTSELIGGYAQRHQRTQFANPNPSCGDPNFSTCYSAYSALLQGPFPGASFSAETSPTRIQGDTNISEGSSLSWDIFEHNSLWDMEAGLNEYAYGDPPIDLYTDDAFDVQNILG